MSVSGGETVPFLAVAAIVVIGVVVGAVWLVGLVVRRVRDQD